MRTLEELQMIKTKLEKELGLIDEELHAHPDFVMKQFSCLDHLNHELEYLRSLIRRVSFVYKISGTTDSRKNQMDYEGYSFKFDANDYAIAWGENWCHSFEHFCEGQYTRTSNNNFSAESRIPEIDVLDEHFKSEVETGELTEPEVIALLLRWNEL